MSFDFLKVTIAMPYTHAYSQGHMSVHPSRLHTVVDVRVCPRVDLINLRRQVRLQANQFCCQRLFSSRERSQSVSVPQKISAMRSQARHRYLGAWPAE